MNNTRRLAKLCTAIITLVMLSNIAYAKDTVANYEASIKTSGLGNYQFQVESHEEPSHEYLPIISKDYFPYSIESFSTEVDNTAPDAVYKAQEVVKVDVVFALGKLQQNGALQSYIPTFTNKLQSAVNYIDAHVEQVETKGIDFSDKFEWNFVVNGRRYFASSGTFYGQDYDEGIDGSISAYGNSLTFRGYGSRPIYDYAMFPNDSEGKLTLEFTIRETNADWHTLDYSGFNFGCSRGNPQSGYSMSFTRNQLIIKGPGVNKTLTKPSGNAFTMRAVVDHSNGAMQIIVNGSEVLNQSGLTFAGYDFGPFVQWGSHCCSSQSVVDFSGIKMEVDSSKSLGEALQDVAWRDGAARFVIHATDVTPVELESGNDDMLAYTITKLLNSNTYLINLGNTANKEALDRILNSITQADGTIKGTFYNNTPIQTAMDKSANYIIDVMKNLSKPVDWILVNTEVLWYTEYRDNERDLPLNYGEHSTLNSSRRQPHDLYDAQTIATSWNTPLTSLRYTDDKIQAEKWRYRHFPQYFDNSTVLETFHNIWISDPVEVFPNPGKYRVNYKRKDNPFYTDTSLTNAFDEYRYWSTHYDRRA